MSELVRTPVRIVGAVRYHEHLIGHEGTAYSGDPERTAVRLLSPLIRLSAEAAAHGAGVNGYVERAGVEFVEIETPTESVLL